MNRRKALKKLGFASLTPFVLNTGFTIPSENVVELPADEGNPAHIEFDKPLTCIIVGAGNRGWGYSRYSVNYSEQMKIVGIAEPVKIRQKKLLIYKPYL